DRWICLDIAWQPQRRAATEALGATTIELDALGDPDRLAELVSGVRVVANMVGPYFRTVGPVLDACIAAGVDYLDICDDADATGDVLSRDAAAKASGTRALTGMGATPGTSNVMVRAAVDVLGSAQKVEICWINDARDSSPAAVEHLWHIFRPYGPNGVESQVPRWEELVQREVEFADTVGTHLTMQLAHSELVTLPHYLGIEDVENFGGLAPADPLILLWALARMGAGAGADIDLLGDRMVGKVIDEYRRTPRSRGGLRIDVVRADCVGIRFQSDSPETMEESTGTPAAAGILMMLDGALAEPGVFAPECLRPVD